MTSLTSPVANAKCSTCKQDMNPANWGSKLSKIGKELRIVSCIDCEWRDKNPKV